jgi:1-acyl-sn-glycerol-3-phosphate acyltransferase
MLKAAKNSWFESVFALYNRNLFRRRFNSFRVQGIAEISKHPGALLLYANHNSWWDGLVAFEISRRAGLDAYVMMEERQLSRLRLFRRLGAFSVVRENAREAYRSIEYAAGLLRQGSAVWIFPQGEIVPSEKRPVGFYPGVSAVIEKAYPCGMAPVAIRYAFKGEFKPDIFVRVGETEVVEDLPERRHGLTKILENSLEQEIVRLSGDLRDEDLSCYQDLI